jgi:hypothetical protein
MAYLFYPEGCPACGGNLHRSRTRGIIEKAMSRFLQIRVARCHRCRSRFYLKPAYAYRARQVEMQSHEREAGIPDNKEGIAADRSQTERDTITGSEKTSGESSMPELVCSPAPSCEPKRQTWTLQASGDGVVKSAEHWQETSTFSARNSKPL